MRNENWLNVQTFLDSIDRCVLVYAVKVNIINNNVESNNEAIRHLYAEVL